jgi:transposase
MPLGNRLSAYEAGQVDALLAEGKSQNKVAERLKRSRKAIQTYVKSRATYFEKRPNGAFPVLKERDKRAIIRHVSATGASITETKRTLGLVASKSTIHNVLSSCNALRYVKAKTKPKLTPRHEASRLDFARQHMTWNLEWRQVIFSDEKKFNLDGPDGIKYYWHDLRKEPKLLSKRVHGGTSVMVWAGYCFYGKSELVLRECKGKADVYQQVLQQHLLPFIGRLGGGNWTFQQDGATVHTAATTMQWFERNKITVLPWPSLSPDLNPIENLWGILVRIVYDNGRRQFNSSQELRAALLDAWNQIELSTLENLSNSMPQRMFAVIRGGGKSSRY